MGPNVYVSVLAVRGRVEPLSGTACLQPGLLNPPVGSRNGGTRNSPPPWSTSPNRLTRIGLGEIAVGSEGFKLKVEISSDKTDYKPREQASIKIKVTTPDGKPAPAGGKSLCCR